MPKGKKTEESKETKKVNSIIQNLERDGIKFTYAAPPLPVERTPHLGLTMLQDGNVIQALDNKEDNIILDEKIREIEYKLDQPPVENVPRNHASPTQEFGVGSETNYGHTRASSVYPPMATTAVIGSDDGTYARGNHRHPAQTTISGNAGSATRLQTARNINGVPFDGTQNITVTPTNQVGTVRNVRTVRVNVAVNTGNNVWQNHTLNLPFSGVSARYSIISQLGTLSHTNLPLMDSNGLMTTFTNSNITFRGTGGELTGSNPPVWTHRLTTIYTIVEYF